MTAVIAAPKESDPFTLYALEGCPYSILAEDFFVKHGVAVFTANEKIPQNIAEYAVKYLVRRDPECKQLLEKIICPLVNKPITSLTFPVIFHYGTYIGGFSDLRTIYDDPF